MRSGKAPRCINYNLYPWQTAYLRSGWRHYFIKLENVSIVSICNFGDKEIYAFPPSSEHGNRFFCFC